MERFIYRSRANKKKKKKSRTRSEGFQGTDEYFLFFVRRSVYTLFGVFGERGNKRAGRRGVDGSMENLNRIQPICPLSIEAMFPKINRNVLLERSNPSWRILYPRAITASAEVCTTVHGYGNPISDTGQKRLRMSRVVKIYRLIDVPGPTHRTPPLFHLPEP